MYIVPSYLASVYSPETIQSIASRIFGQSNGQIISDSLVINGLLYMRCLIDTSARVEACPELAPLPRNDHFYLWSDRVGTSLCEILQPNLGALKQRLLVCNDPSLNTSATPRCTYLSSARLHIARFLPYLITAKSDALVREMLNLDLINIVMDLFFLFPCNSFLHSTCECLIRLIVLRAILNITCSQSSPDPSPSNTVSFNSTDAFHQQFFTSNECSPKSGGFFRLNEYAIVR
ncbi:Serine/threonine-protein phosphatase 6 regulatory subunit 2 [Fasciolopsis buskii]|uniref:Serine/threonine-protein phosphatase 6 regulatory subunit 2 n=1 Tax=Fasciolopsis buskii TaxID=27845 RepID=A0A8E0S148_9TREM|nr:Serine/threonine-protein phosphatase 6 regulatory subunit 2 [Fasciolopsis buski]